MALEAAQVGDRSQQDSQHSKREQQIDRAQHICPSCDGRGDHQYDFTKDGKETGGIETNLDKVTATFFLLGRIGQFRRFRDRFEHVPGRVDKGKGYHSQQRQHEENIRALRHEPGNHRPNEQK
jgi:hypothetical protein